MLLCSQDCRTDTKSSYHTNYEITRNISDKSKSIQLFSFRVDQYREIERDSERKG